MREVHSQIFEYGKVLRSGTDLIRCDEAIRALERLSHNQQLDEYSRDLAREILREFASRVIGS